MKELIKKDWEYILYEEGDKLILSVLCGTVALYNVDVVLDEEQNQQYEQAGINYLDTLARQILSQPEKYLKQTD